MDFFEYLCSDTETDDKHRKYDHKKSHIRQHLLDHDNFWTQILAYDRGM